MTSHISPYTAQNTNLLFIMDVSISLLYSTNTPRVFLVETTCKRSLPRRFNMEYTRCVCMVYIVAILVLTLIMFQPFQPSVIFLLEISCLVCSANVTMG